MTKLTLFTKTYKNTAILGSDTSIDIYDQMTRFDHERYKPFNAIKVTNKSAEPIEIRFEGKTDVMEPVPAGAVLTVDPAENFFFYHAWVHNNGNNPIAADDIIIEIGKVVG